MLFKNKSLILFDLDGTLIDSAPDLARAVNHMLETFGLEPYDLETIHHWVGNGAQMLVKRALHGKRDVENESIDQGLFDKALASFMAYYRANLCIDTYPYRGVPQTLDSLQKKGYTLAIVTNKPYTFVSPILQKLDLQKYFSYHIGGDSLPLKKPDPSPLLHICEHLQTPITQSIMIGDSKNDILAAKAARMESVGVTYGYNYGEDIHRISPDTVVDNFVSLDDLFGERADG